MKNEHIARLIYAAHSEYNIIQGLGSRCRWDEADRPSRQAYISVVERTLLQPTKSAFDNHELWRASWEASCASSFDSSTSVSIHSLSSASHLRVRAHVCVSTCV